MSQNAITPDPPAPHDRDEPPAGRADAPAGPRERTAHGFGWSYAGLMLLLPPLIYYLWICVRFYDGALVLPRSLAELRQLAGHVPGPTGAAMLIYGAWIGLQALLQRYAPGPIRLGAALADGTRLPYRMNGWLSFWTTLLLVGALVLSGVVPATLLADHFGPLLTVANLFTFALSLYVYQLGRQKGGGEGGLRGYFLGSALNPRDGSFDWKIFCEARPGLILWALLNLSLMAKQQQVLGRVTLPMALCCAFQFLYVADYFYHEEAILSTWDIRHENFGWMLLGSLVWVPFTYSLQAQYLLHHGGDLSALAAVGITVLNMAGYYLFRSANLQKHRFRQDPEARGTVIWGRKAESIRTARGSLLLTSGWWGVGRHLNYTGDLMMGLAWCLLCGGDRLLPYFYVIYFTILLVHRERRDHRLCQARYGADWDAYCQKVRWRMIPGVY